MYKKWCHFGAIDLKCVSFSGQNVDDIQCIKRNIGATLKRWHRHKVRQPATSLVPVADKKKGSATQTDG